MERQKHAYEYFTTYVSLTDSGVIYLFCFPDKSLFMVRALFQSHGEPKISNFDSFGAYRENIAIFVVNVTEA